MKERKHLKCSQCGEALEIVEEIVEKMEDFGIGVTQCGPRKFMAFRCDGCGRQNLLPLGEANP